MRILLFDPEVGGHHLEYAGHLARFLRGRGDDVVFTTWDGTTISRDLIAQHSLGEVRHLGPQGSDRLAWIGGWPLTRARGMNRCLQLARKLDADVVHFLYLDRSELGLLASLSLQPRPSAIFGTLFWPYFVHEANDNPGIPKGLFHKASAYALGRLLTEGKMTGLFVHSQRIRSLLIGRLGRPAVGNKIFVVPDPAKSMPTLSIADARAELDLPLGLPMILFFGGARPDKGPDILLRALPRLGGDWLAVFAGEPGIIGNIEADECRSKLPHPDRLVTRFGYVSEEDASRYFGAADVVVLPYRHTFRGTSGVLRRAAASGKPIIASDVGDVGPEVRKAGLGTVITPESPHHLAIALRDFLAAPDSFARGIESRAIEFAQLNDWRVLGRAVRDQYLRALA